MNWKNLLFSALAFGAVTAFVACDDDDVDLKTSVLTMSFDYKVAGDDFVSGNTYTINGTAVRLDIAHFYVSGIELQPDAGDLVKVEGKTLLVKPESGEQEVAEVDKGQYQTIKFDVGVQPEDNDQTEEDFDARPADDPLARQEPAMHWNWNSGYRFLRIDGLVDTDGDGTPETALEYHLGVDGFLRSVTLDLPNEINSDEQNLGFVLDVAALFEGIDIATEYSMHTGDAPAVAEEFADNIPAAISRQ